MGDTSSKGRNGLLLSSHHIFEVQFDTTHVHATRFHIFGFTHVVIVRVVKKGLARNAPNIQASTTKGRVFLNAHGLNNRKVKSLVYLHAKLSCLDSCNISTRARANNNKVLLTRRQVTGELAVNSFRKSAGSKLQG